MRKCRRPVIRRVDVPHDLTVERIVEIPFVQQMGFLWQLSPTSRLMADTISAHIVHSARDGVHAAFRQILQKAGSAASALSQAGFDASALRQAGLDASDSRQIGVVASALSQAGFDASAMRQAGLDASASRQAGSDA